MRSESPGPEFLEWYQFYPRKVARHAAEKVWRKLSPEQRNAAIESVKDHARYWRLKGTETEYIPHPATWLNQHRWEDELPAVVDNKGANKFKIINIMTSHGRERTFDNEK